MSEERDKIMCATLLSMAKIEANDQERRFMLKRAAELDPFNVEAKQLLVQIPNSEAVGFVAIERVEKLGKVNRNYEGQILKEMPDGSLKPIDGKDMDYLIDNYPAFLKNWKLDHDQ